MKKNRYKSFIILLLSFISISAYSYDFELDGLAYTITDVSNRKVEVADKSGHGYNIDIVGTVKIPEKVVYNNIEFTVTSIGESAFRYGNMSKVVLPQSIKTIHKEAFSLCMQLKKMNLPEGLTQVDYFGIKDTAIDTLIIPSTLVHIETYAFQSNHLSYLEFAEGTTNIPERSFEGNSVKKIVFPSTLQRIGASAFWGGRKTIIVSKAKESPSNFGSTWVNGYSGKHYTYNPFTYADSDERPIPVILVPKGSKKSYQQQLTHDKPAWPVVSFEEYDETTDFSLIGTTFDSGENSYFITNASEGNYNVQLVKCKTENCTELTIPQYIKIGDINYRVNAINPDVISKFDLNTINIGIENPIPIYGNTFSPRTFLFANVFVPEDAIENYKNAEIWKDFSNINPLNKDVSIQTPNVICLNDEFSNITSGFYFKDCIKYERNVSNEYGTFCLPFPICLNDVAGINKVYIPMDEVLYNTSTNWLMLLLKEVPMDSTVPEGTPFIAQFGNSDVQIKNSISVNYESDLSSNPAEKQLKVFNFNGKDGILKQNSELKVSWGGTYVATPTIEGLNSFNGDGTFGQHIGQLNPFRAYVMQTSINNAKIAGVMFAFDEEVTTGIINLESSKYNDDIYNLQGQKMKYMRKGQIYISNGKKVIR